MMPGQAGQELCDRDKATERRTALRPRQTKVKVSACEWKCGAQGGTPALGALLAFSWRQHFTTSCHPFALLVLTCINHRHVIILIYNYLKHSQPSHLEMKLGAPALQIENAFCVYKQDINIQIGCC